MITQRARTIMITKRARIIIITQRARIIIIEKITMITRKASLSLSLSRHPVPVTARVRVVQRVLMVQRALITMTMIMTMIMVMDQIDPRAPRVLRVAALEAKTPKAREETSPRAIIMMNMITIMSLNLSRSLHQVTERVRNIIIMKTTMIIEATERTLTPHDQIGRAS